MVGCNRLGALGEREGWEKFVAERGEVEEDAILHRESVDDRAVKVAVPPYGAAWLARHHEVDVASDPEPCASAFLPLVGEAALVESESAGCVEGVEIGGDVLADGAFVARDGVVVGETARE